MSNVRDPNINYLELESPYPYTPDLITCLTYFTLFTLLTLIHCGLAIKYRYWVIFYALIPGGSLEILGWGGRLWSHYSVLNSNPFIMQMACLIIGPAFFSAWAYTGLGYCITSLGPAYSLLNARVYIIIFVSADIVCLVLQAMGGGLAAISAKGGYEVRIPTNIMLSGVLVQLGTMSIFTILAIDFITRVIIQKPYSFRIRTLESQNRFTGVSDPSGNKYYGGSYDNIEMSTHTYSPSPTRNSPSGDGERLRKAGVFLAGIAFASAMIYVRGVFRSVELAQGWSGRLMTTEVYFTWLDGFPMVLAYTAFAVIHPGWLIERRR